MGPNSSTAPVTVRTAGATFTEMLDELLAMSHTLGRAEEWLEQCAKERERATPGRRRDAVANLRRARRVVFESEKRLEKARARLLKAFGQRGA